MVHATNISLSIGARAILRGIDFTAAPGQITAIVGPNGSGKTTLLRALTGDIAYQGQVSLNARDIQTIPAHELAAMRAVLAQATSLAFPFTVTEVVRLGLSRSPGAEHVARVPMALTRVGLCGFGGRFYQELSGGEQQRVQLARVLTQVWHATDQAPKTDAQTSTQPRPTTGPTTGQPRWLFLDEPVSSLDIGHQLQVMQIARDFADQGGGVVTVMHDLNLTAMFADSIALISEGQVLHQGGPEDVLRNDLLSQAYRCQLRVNTPPPAATYLLPHAARLAAE